MKQYLFLLTCMMAGTASAQSLYETRMGDCRLTLNADADKYAAVTFDFAPAMNGVRLGLTTSAREFDKLRLVDAGNETVEKTDYHILQGKRLDIKHEAKRRTYTFVNRDSDTLRVEFRVANDGVAFRYIIPQAGTEGETLNTELTTFNIADGQNRWIAAYDPGYEQFYPLATSGKDLKPNQDHKWGLPALIEPSEGVFVLLAESDVMRDHAACLLSNADNETQYRVVYASDDQPCTAQWTSPWRLMIAGSLARVTESTMVTDVATPAVTDKTDWIQPAPVSWIYWAHNHGSRELNLIKQYIDLAVDMHWPYMLVDAEWDEMTNGNNIEEALKYAHIHGVKPMLWYNSTTAWINGAPGPKYRLNKREDRQREFAWLQNHGVSGIKVDFFDGDNMESMNYSIDILEDALQYNLMVVLHGAPVPRGWQRTYPNLMTVEGVYGAEWYNNLPVLTNRAACHNATLPFTRNVIGPMDYTPGTFSDSQHPHITSHGHELALPVLFESSLQHMPDRPSSYAALPQQVRDMLSALPTAWDETILIDGYPGHHVVMARRSGTTWYVAGINGTDDAVTLTADLSRLNLSRKCNVTLFADGAQQQEFSISTPKLSKSKTIEVPCLPRGGFVAVLN